MINVVENSLPPPPDQEAPPQVRFYLTHKDAVAPFRAYEDDAGYDLTSLINITIEPQTLAVVPIGVAFDIPKGLYGQILPKSGLALKKELTTDGGIIDRLQE